MMTDARHCFRKNAKFSDIVCLGNITHKVLRLETISRSDFGSAQTHELHGTKKIYEYLDSKDCPVKSHAHDDNTSISKFIRERNDNITDNKDTWHLTKNLAKGLKSITSGPTRSQNKTWHVQLSDKAGSIKTHLYWAMKNLWRYC